MTERPYWEPTPPVTVLPADIGYIRFLNAVPDSLPVDLYINGRLIARALAYQEFTDYLRAMPGEYTLEIFPYGNRTKPLYAAELELAPFMIYTAAFIGCCGEYEVELVEDKPPEEHGKQSYLRFIDFSPKSPGYDIYINGDLLVSDIAFEEVSKYFTLPPGTHRLEVKETGTDRTVITHPGMVLKAGNYYAGYIVGLYAGSPEPEILLPLEGAGYLKF